MQKFDPPKHSYEKFEIESLEKEKIEHNPRYNYNYSDEKCCIVTIVLVIVIFIFSVFMTMLRFNLI